MVARWPAKRRLLTRSVPPSRTHREDEYSINNLLAYIARLEEGRAGDIKARDDALEQLRDELFTTKKLLSEEQRMRREENTSSDATIKSLQNESARLRAELAELHAAKKAQEQSLALQLADEAADKQAKMAANAAAAEREAVARKQEKEGLNGQLALLRAEKNEAEEEAAKRYAMLEAEKSRNEAMLRAQLAALNNAKAESEEKLDERFRKLETLKLQETTLLKNRVARLSKLQDAALNAGGSKARSMLYMESMKSKTQQDSTMSVRGETDVAGLPADAAAAGGAG
jgi:hypothetical protein